MQPRPKTPETKSIENFNKILDKFIKRQIVVRTSCPLSRSGGVPYKYPELYSVLYMKRIHDGKSG